MAAPTIVRAGPAFALLIAATHSVETQPAESGHHPHADHNAVGTGTELVLVPVVFLVVVGQTLTRIIRVKDGTDLLSTFRRAS